MDAPQTLGQRKARPLAQGGDLVRRDVGNHHHPRPALGVSAGTSSRAATLGGIVTIAVADSLSDALGIHISEEAEGVHTDREIWTATLATLLAKLTTALTFTIPVILVELHLAVLVSLVWASVALAILSFSMARDQGVTPRPIILEHLGVAALVVGAAHAVGTATSSLS